MSQNTERVLSSCTHLISGNNCKKCGIYLHQSSNALKTNLFDSLLNCSANKYLHHMRKKKTSILQFKQINESVLVTLQSICQKFQYTIQTLVLGLYIFAKTFQKQQRDDKFWASASLLVASKAIQLDRRVPYLNRYQKYAQKSYPQQQYENAQKIIFQEMNFNIQITTFISFLHFYMTNGILFEKDSLSLSNIKVIEDQLLLKAKQMLKNGLFLSFCPEKLALSLIKQIRIKHRLEPWRKQLENVSGYKSENIQTIQKNNVLKPLCSLSNRARQKLSTISQQNTIALMQNSLQMTENKPRLIRRKNDSMLRQNLKQNSFRPHPELHQTLFTNIRKQSLSVTKYPAQGILPIHLHQNFGQRLIPLSNFQSRRI